MNFYCPILAKGKDRNLLSVLLHLASTKDNVTFYILSTFFTLEYNVDL